MSNRSNGNYFGARKLAGVQEERDDQENTRREDRGEHRNVHENGHANSTDPAYKTAREEFSNLVERNSSGLERAIGSAGHKVNLDNDQQIREFVRNAISAGEDQGMTAQQVVNLFKTNTAGAINLIKNHQESMFEGHQSYDNRSSGHHQNVVIGSRPDLANQMTQGSQHNAEHSSGHSQHNGHNSQLLVGPNGELHSPPNSGHNQADEKLEARVEQIQMAYGISDADVNQLKQTNPNWAQVIQNTEEQMNSEVNYFQQVMGLSDRAMAEYTSSPGWFNELQVHNDKLEQIIGNINQENNDNANSNQRASSGITSINWENQLEVVKNQIRSELHDDSSSHQNSSHLNSSSFSQEESHDEGSQQQAMSAAFTEHRSDDQQHGFAREHGFERENDPNGDENDFNHAHNHSSEFHDNHSDREHTNNHRGDDDDQYHGNSGDGNDFNG